MLEANRSSMVRAVLPLLTACLMTIPAQAQYGGGTGESNDPYLIRTAEQMNGIGVNAADWGKHFRLVADIDLSEYTGTSFNLIGNATAPFSGVFDGNGLSIRNFSYTCADRHNAGLFGYVCGANAEIRNLTLADPEVHAKAGQYVGILAGRLAGKVDNCHVFGGTISGGQDTGGLIGDLTDSYTEPTTGIPSRITGYLQDCSFTGIISGLQRVGGLVGCSNGGTVARCFTDADISAENYVGGLLGQNNAVLSNCYATGAVTGDNYVGGLAGLNSHKVATCYAAGRIKGTGPYVGGLIGSNGGSAFLSFWDVQTSGRTTGTGGKGRSTAQMQNAQTFLGWGAYDNGGIWTIDDGRDYPRLAWESRSGQTIQNIQLSDFVSWTGVQDDPSAIATFVITTAEGLNAVGMFPCEWDKHFILGADIDLSAYTGDQFNLIGNSSTKFTGVFDGQGHTIAHFTYVSRSREAVGLFACVGQSAEAEIRNVRLVDPNVIARQGYRIGALVGNLYSATIANCVTEDGNVSGSGDIGGLVGYCEGTITDCYTTCDVSGTRGAGGVAGRCSGCVMRCHAAGEIKGQWRIAGLVGDCDGGTITDCFATGSVSGDNSVGGLVGYSRNGTISSCHATGIASGSESVGGLVGDSHDDSTISHCYTTGSVYGTSHWCGGLVGYNGNTITACYATAVVQGGRRYCQMLWMRFLADAFSVGLG